MKREGLRAVNEGDRARVHAARVAVRVYACSVCMWWRIEEGRGREWSVEP